MTGVPNGTYYLEWFSGENWSPDLKVGSAYKGGFQTNANFTKTRDSNDWMKVEGYQVWTVTLYTVAGGDVESEEINACSIKVEVDINGKNEDWLVMFKNETHNHPTEIEPFGGAGDKIEITT